MILEYSGIALSTVFLKIERNKPQILIPNFFILFPIFAFCLVPRLKDEDLFRDWSKAPQEFAEGSFCSNIYFLLPNLENYIG